MLLFVCIALLLGWIGGKPVEYPFVIVGQFCSIMYFVYFLVISPIIIDLEHFFWDNDLYLSKFFNVNNLQNNDDIILSNTQNVQKILEKISLRSGTS